MDSEVTVFVVDGDEAARESFRALLQSHGFDVELHATTDAFLGSYDPSRPGCLLLDLHVPGVDGLDLREYLRRHPIRAPVIVVSANADVETAVRVMKSGAMDFIKKPYAAADIVTRVREALVLDAERREVEAERAAAAAELALLTPRECEIMELLVTGKPSKQIAFELAVSRKTVDIHRQHIMMKLRVNSIVDLVQMVQLSRGGRPHATEGRPRSAVRASSPTSSPPEP